MFADVISQPSRFSIQHLQLFIEFFQSHRELEVVGWSSAKPTYRPGFRLQPCASTSASVATLHSPATSMYLPFGKFCFINSALPASDSVILSSVKPNDVGNELNLFGCEIPMCSVNLSERCGVHR